MKKGKDLKPHIGIFGRRNNGKSSFINTIVGQEIAIISEHAGTTTDPVKKSVEIFGIGPTVLIDTAGIDDHGELGEKRVKKTMEVIKNIDFAILLIARNEFGDFEIDLLNHFKTLDIPLIIVHGKSDLEEISMKTLDKIRLYTGAEIVDFSAVSDYDIENIVNAIKRNMPESAYQKPSLFKGIVKSGDIVLLITPIDSEAPDGRMILPQVMAWRDLLDKDCICISVKETELENFIKTGIKPALAVTDSQVFEYVYSVLPKEIQLTSFSILFARLKGDFKTYVNGAKKIGQLKNDDKVLILESCTHQVSCDDIGRYKIPKWIESYSGKKLQFEIVSGLNNIPEQIEDYALVIQCGGCVATRKQILNRIRIFSKPEIPVTNYGLAIAYLTGIFKKVLRPFNIENEQ